MQVGQGTPVLLEGLLFQHQAGRRGLLVDTALQAGQDAGKDETTLVSYQAGQPFDPYLHVAVGTTGQLPSGATATPNSIVAEERRGYRTQAGVIRFAEVIVYRPK